MNEADEAPWTDSDSDGGVSEEYEGAVPVMTPADKANVNRWLKIGGRPPKYSEDECKEK